VVDAAAGKASVGLVAAELLAVGRVTVIERDPSRIAACRSAATRLARQVPVDVRSADVGDASAWPEEADVVVALHACGGAADLVIDRAIASRARQLLVVPCCYGASVPFRARAADIVARMDLADDDVLARRMTASLVDTERKLRLEAGGYETTLEEFVAPTITPHNLLFRARRTGSDVRISRAKARLEALGR
jgi:predicted RNA methylase